MDRILLRSYYITRLDLTSLFEPTFDTPTTGEEERRLHLFERVAPTKPFIVWWRSVQSETDPLKNYDRIFDWYVHPRDLSGAGGEAEPDPYAALSTCVS
ncbi:hypothetical protein BDV25DRAFT_135555 [Aspergillus avenaceus]|uniref:Uncharacterized protein n=1 Tax=Aspergillus avenaceus TaxID=36643 RepID=A0A5N6U8I0_ASPAV|nr:hypothetical protein BDV25DRAFT_135555 [Aspergillus avenaceus]